MNKEECFRAFPLILMHRSPECDATPDKQLEMMRTIVRNNDSIDVRFLSYVRYPGVMTFKDIKQYQASDRLIMNFTELIPVCIVADINRMIDLTNPGRTMMLIVPARIALYTIKSIIANKEIKEKDIDLVVLVTDADKGDHNAPLSIVNGALLDVLTEAVKAANEVYQRPFHFVICDDIFCMLDKYGHDYDKWDNPLFEDWFDKQPLRQTLDFIMRQPYFQDLSIYYRGASCSE